MTKEGRIRKLGDELVREIRDLTIELSLVQNRAYNLWRKIGKCPVVLGNNRDISTCWGRSFNKGITCLCPCI